MNIQGKFTHSLFKDQATTLAYVPIFEKKSCDIKLMLGVDQDAVVGLDIILKKSIY